MRGCRATWRRVTCWPSPRPVPIAARWRATTTRCPSRHSSPSTKVRAGCCCAGRPSTTFSLWTRDDRRYRPLEGGGRVEDVNEKPLKVALLGCGVVGSEVVRLLHAHRDDLAHRVGVPLDLAGVAVRRPPRSPDLPVDAALFTDDAASLGEQDDVDIVIEVIGGIEPARSLLVRVLERGASVVTANKALLAEDGATLPDAPRRGATDLYFEASVAGAI